ncbi:MAG: hypothetical protein AAF518_26410 [Spirochaetota bacterium]
MHYYILKCEGCGTPLASNVKNCPYCNRLNSHKSLVTDANIKTKKKGLVIKEGAHLQIGKDPDATGQRDCPFCGDVCSLTQEKCYSCGNRIIIKSMHIQSLKVNGGKLSISGGGKLTIGGSTKQDKKLAKAVKKNDLAGAKKAINDGANPAYEFKEGSLVTIAAANGNEEMKKYLLSIGVP